MAFMLVVAARGHITRTGGNCSGAVAGGGGGSPQGEQVKLPRLQRDEQPGIGQFGAVPLERCIVQQTGEPPAPAGQVRPAQRDPPLRWLRGKIDDYYVPVCAGGPGPGQEVAAGL